MARVLDRDRQPADGGPVRGRRRRWVLPPATQVELIGRGSPYVRFLPGPAGAPTVLLLHGLTGTADQTWAPSYRPLNRHFSVVALDLRGHGGGIPAEGTYRLEECVDDVAAVIRTLGVGPVVAVGYSMGGAVAQLLWRDHPRLVRGLVLCSTAANFGVGPVERLAAAISVAAAAAVRTVPPIFRIGFDIASSFATRDVEDPARAWLNGDYGRCSFETFAAAAAALARFTSRDWVGGIDVPTAVIVTRQDRLIPPARQRELAGLIPGAVVHEVDGGHGAFVTAAERFLPPLLLSCRAVTEGGTP